MNQGLITIRPERSGDRAGVYEVEHQAFNRLDEARLVDALRANNRVTVSLVAVQGSRVVGHVLFSPAVVVSATGKAPAVALGPVAVLPDLQGQGIGSQLISAGLQACRDAGHQRVIVLGHAAYYPRFGFVPASTFGVTSQLDVPDDVFMALALVPDGWTGISGQARYAPEFAAVD
jgi:putative acetyltransferase